jgi:hypothetical protein
MASARWDETWHRLREWTNGSGPSERLAAQILKCEGYASFDPSHPLGGRDGGRDAVCMKNGQRWVMAVYFPRGQQSHSDLRIKFLHDVEAASTHDPAGIAFVTNQELTLSERSSLRKAVSQEVDLFHLERIAAILDCPAMAQVREQFLGIATEEFQIVNLGGMGGLAPGAGGGGGAAMGERARGGDGGPGGKITYIGSPGRAPGAGGGGGGAEGDDAHGGNGGGGGDAIHFAIDPEKLAALRKLGFHRMEFRVGEGGKDGSPGEDTIVNLVSEDGKVLESIKAKAGMPGRPPQTGFSGRVATSDDVKKGLRLSSALLAECVHIKNGLLYLLGAGWSNYEFVTVPFEAQWPLCLSFDTGSVSTDSQVLIEVIVRQPDGFQVLAESLELMCAPGKVSRVNRVLLLRFTGSVLGVWSIEVRSGDIVFATMPIEVGRQTGLS